MVKFVDGRIHATVEGEKTKNENGLRFVFMFRERIDIDIFCRVIREAAIIHAADRKGSFIIDRGEEILDKSWFDFVVAIDETNIVTGCEF